jgi:hypothetical protein
VAVCDITSYDGHGFFYFLSFLVFGLFCCKLCMTVRLYVSAALDFDVWMCSSLRCENGCCFIGFVGAIQVKQDYMKEYLTLWKAAKSHC